MALPLVIRRNDFSLDDDERLFGNSVEDYLKAHCTPTVVAASEPLGYDETLWHNLLDMGVVDAGLASDGDAAQGLVQGSLIAELCGYYTAPVPYMEALTVARLLARIGTPSALALSVEVSRGQKIVGLAPRSRSSGWPQLVGSGAVADAVIGMSEGRIVLLEGADEIRHVRVQGHLPTGWWAPAAAVTTLVAGDSADQEFRRACDEFKVLAASALAGLGAASVVHAAAFACERRTKGVPIGALQGVSHPLVDGKIGVEGARQTARKAAWFCEFEPDGDPKLPGVAFIAASRAADRACRTAMHVCGGMGVMVDGEAARYFLRCKAWSAVVADVADVHLELAAVLRRPRYQDAVYPSML